MLLADGEDLVEALLVFGIVLHQVAVEVPVNVGGGNGDADDEGGLEDVAHQPLGVNHPAEGLDVTLHRLEGMMEMPGDLQRLLAVEPQLHRPLFVGDAGADVADGPPGGDGDPLLFQNSDVRADGAGVAVEQEAEFLLSEQAAPLPGLHRHPHDLLPPLGRRALVPVDLEVLLAVDQGKDATGQAALRERLARRLLLRHRMENHLAVQERPPLRPFPHREHLFGLGDDDFAFEGRAVGAADDGAAEGALGALEPEPGQGLILLLVRGYDHYRFLLCSRIKVLLPPSRSSAGTSLISRDCSTLRK
jgi:hypothetical protein